MLYLILDKGERVDETDSRFDTLKSKFFSPGDYQVTKDWRYGEEYPRQGYDFAAAPAPGGPRDSQQENE